MHLLLLKKHLNQKSFAYIWLKNFKNIDLDPKLLTLTSLSIYLKCCASIAVFIMDFLLEVTLFMLFLQARNVHLRFQLKIAGNTSYLKNDCILV